MPPLYSISPAFISSRFSLVFLSFNLFSPVSPPLSFFLFLFYIFSFLSYSIFVQHIQMVFPLEMIRLIKLSFHQNIITILQRLIILMARIKALISMINTNTQMLVNRKVGGERFLIWGCHPVPSNRKYTLLNTERKDTHVILWISNSMMIGTLLLYNNWFMLMDVLMPSQQEWLNHIKVHLQV